MDNTHTLAAEAVPAYLIAGKALVTILNTDTEVRYTYRITAPGKTAGERAEAGICFVEVLTGADNTNDYTYIGVIIRETGRFTTTKASRLSEGDVRVKGISWLTRNVERLAEYPGVEIRHHNHCGRCSRTLTVPESIDTGLGPVCAKAMKVAWTRS